MQDLQHNVVNILYTIKGMIEAHLSKAEENCFQSQDDALEHARSIMKRIYDQTNRALTITKRIRLAMRAQTRADQPMADVSVRETWEEAIEILQKQYSFDSLEVITHIPQEFPLIKCHRKDLLEIFYTLLQNAVQSMHRNGKIIIRTNLQFQADDKPQAVITLSDTGAGIPEEILSHLFEPFFTTKPLEEGNGLGLCLVKSLVKKNQGSITVSSFKGCGATFTLGFAVASVRNPKEPNPLAMI